MFSSWEQQWRFRLARNCKYKVHVINCWIIDGHVIKTCTERRGFTTQNCSYLRFISPRAGQGVKRIGLQQRKACHIRRLNSAQWQFRLARNCKYKVHVINCWIIFNFSAISIEKFHAKINTQDKGTKHYSLQLFMGIL